MATSFSDEQQKKIYAKYLATDIRERQQALDQYKQYHTEYKDLSRTLRDLPSETEYDITVPLGPLAFMPGKLIHTNEILVLLGDNWFVERSAAQAATIADRRGVFLEKKIEEYEEQVRLLKMKMEGRTSSIDFGLEQTHEVNEEGEPIIEIKEELKSDSEHAGAEDVSAQVDTPTIKSSVVETSTAAIDGGLYDAKIKDYSSLDKESRDFLELLRRAEEEEVAEGWRRVEPEEDKAGGEQKTKTSALPSLPSTSDGNKKGILKKSSPLTYTKEVKPATPKKSVCFGEVAQALTHEEEEEEEEHIKLSKDKVSQNTKATLFNSLVQPVIKENKSMEYDEDKMEQDLLMREVAQAYYQRRRVLMRSHKLDKAPSVAEEVLESIPGVGFKDQVEQDASEREDEEQEEEEAQTSGGGMRVQIPADAELESAAKRLDAPPPVVSASDHKQQQQQQAETGEGTTGKKMSRFKMARLGLI
ncbi:hypothetical protein EV182_000429 [Spiromyces aspiralis]|uniref:Uncharacterized protein n=1 Tax=Spiromyces aspiralis TaxID=68401 RepID=A0ACC1HYA3_9FUNG|nr:hypothetical protein EV182_000429 [Spiromyces aspiralis]